MKELSIPFDPNCAPDAWAKEPTVVKYLEKTQQSQKDEFERGIAPFAAALEGATKAVVYLTPIVKRSNWGPRVTDWTAAGELTPLLSSWQLKNAVQNLTNRFACQQEKSGSALIERSSESLQAALGNTYEEGETSPEENRYLPVFLVERPNKTPSNVADCVLRDLTDLSISLGLWEEHAFSSADQGLARWEPEVNFCGELPLADLRSKHGAEELARRLWYDLRDWCEEAKQHSAVIETIDKKGARNLWLMTPWAYFRNTPQETGWQHLGELVSWTVQMYDDELSAKGWYNIFEEFRSNLAEAERCGTLVESVPTAIPIETAQWYSDYLRQKFQNGPGVGLTAMPAAEGASQKLVLRIAKSSTFVFAPQLYAEARESLDWQAWVDLTNDRIMGKSNLPSPPVPHPESPFPRRLVGVSQSTSCKNERSAVWNATVAMMGDLRCPLCESSPPLQNGDNNHADWSDDDRCATEASRWPGHFRAEL